MLAITELETPEEFEEAKRKEWLPSHFYVRWYVEEMGSNGESELMVYVEGIGMDWEGDQFTFHACCVNLELHTARWNKLGLESDVLETLAHLSAECERRQEQMDDELGVK